MTAPVLVLVIGPAASGKTTLARRVGAIRSMPVLAKDDLKEALLDRLGHDSPSRSEELELAAYDVLFAVAGSVLRAGVSVVVESDVTPSFSADRVRELARDAEEIVQVSCRARGDVLLERFERRMRQGNRHPGHFEAYYLEHSAAFRASLLRGYSDPLDLPGRVIEVDTTDFSTVDDEALAARI